MRGALHLPAQCTLATAEGLKSRLAALLRNVKPITLDAQGVERIDAAGMQLLTAFVCERGASGLAVRIESPSSSFVEAQHLLGLDGLFGSARAPETGTES